MSAAALAEPNTRTADRLIADSPSEHVVCCDENKTLCGLDATDYEWTSNSDPSDCVVCAELAWPTSLAGCGTPDCPYAGAA